MNVTRTIFIRRLIIFVSTLVPAIEAVGQGYDVPLVPASSTDDGNAAPSDAAAYDDGTGHGHVYSGYQSQTAFQTSLRRNAAVDVLQNTVGYAVAAPFGPRISLDGVFGDRMGVDGNDYSVSTFLPWHIDPGRNLLFAVARGTSTDLGDFVGNFGVGQRIFYDDLNRIIGASGWFDIDDSHNQVYYRAGAQVEYISRYLEVRGGVDIVVQDDQRLLSQGFTDDPPFFRAHNIISNFFTTNEFAYDQGYLEAGGPLPYIGRYGVNAYAGPYFMWHKDDEEAVGVMGRLSAEVTSDLQVSVRYTNDQIFGSNTSVNVSLSLPAGGIRQVFRSSPREIIRSQSPDGYVPVQSNRINRPRTRSVASRMGDNVVREMRIPVFVRREVFPLAEIDPRDGMPIIVNHVDPNATSMGNGTFELPFSTLEEARQDNVPGVDIIRVIPNSDDSGTDLALNAPFGLFDNQRLLASSSTHTYTSRRGTLVLPSFTGAGLGPLVTNLMGGDVIQLANNNEVSGFRIDGGGTGNGIVGNLTNFNLNRNTIQNTVTGIRLLNAQGIGLIDQNTITGSTADGVRITVTGGNTLNLTASNNTIGANGDNGLELVSTGSSTVNATLTGNIFGDGMELAGNGSDGFHFIADSGTANIVIGGPTTADGNIFIGNGDDGVDFNLTGTAIATLLAQNNTTVSGATQVGLNFTGTSFSDFPTLFPPDTMGSVGPNHIIEFINSAYAIYDKVTGNLISRVTDEQFWIDSGLAIVNSDTFDPRIIFDTQSGRWFATGIDREGANSNTIYIAVSRTSDPTMGFQGVQFQADSAGARFNDFDMLGLDADGVYITTNNFNPGFVDTSLYSIPKADLIAATPSLANMTRIENQPAGTLPFRTQPVVDFGPSDGRAALLSAIFSGGSTLTRLDVLGSTGAAATLTAPTTITVGAYTPPVNADQPGPKANISTGSAFQSNIVEVGNSLWAVQAITDATTGNVAVRWYEIDETTNAVLQSGTIVDSNLDFYYPSIAVNQNGNVVIGYSGSSDNQFVSTYASVGRTSGGTTTFEAPMLLKAGVSDYERIDNIGRNRWGDYSATVVDPVDPNTFWTFQEFVDATDSYAIQISQVRVGGGGNTGDGISITATGSSVLTNATIDRNILTDNAGAGLRITANGGVITNAVITNNTATRNGTGAFLTSNAGGMINTTVSGNQFDMNTNNSTGFYARANGLGSIISVNSFTNNTASNNGNGNGLRFEATASGRIDLTNITGNTVSGNGINGAFIRSNGIGSVIAGSIGVNGQASNVINANVEAGILIEATNGGSILGPGNVGNFAVVNNTIGATGEGNVLGGIVAIADSNIVPPTNSVLNLAIGGPSVGDANSIVGNMDAGVIFRTRTFAQGTVLIQNNLISDTLENTTTADPNDPLGDGIFLDRGDNSLLTAMVLTNMSIDNANDGMRVISTGDDPANLNQPSPGTANLVTFNNNTFTGNMRHGASFSPQADSVLIGNGMLNTITGNTMDGIHIATVGDAGFGNPATGIFSRFDGNDLSDNLDDGVEIVINDSSRVFLSIQSSNAVGLTTISNNMGDGIAINNTSTSMSNIIVQSDPLIGNTMFRTLIDNNGDSAVNGGNGILIDNAAGTSTYSVQRTDITSNNVFVDAMGNNINGDGIQINNTSGSPTYNIGSTIVAGALTTTGLGNAVQSNAGNGVGITITGGSPLMNFGENFIGARVGDLAGGNMGHGFNIAASGASNAPVLNFVANQVTRNTGRGANILLTGTLGTRLTPAQFNFQNGNVISANGLEGLFYSANPGVVQDRTVTLANANEPMMGANDLPTNLWDDRLRTTPPTMYADAFRNLITQNNSILRIVNNSIQNNGTRGVDSDMIGGVDGDGVYIRVATNSYVAADVQGNALGGNLQDDFRAESFLTTDAMGNTIMTALSVDRTGAANVDSIVLKDTAQLDLRFGLAGNINTGNQINVTATGVTNTDDGLTGNVGVTLFQVDNGPGLNPGPNSINLFTQFGVTQDINNAFTAGGYSLRNVADGAFPNLNFPVSLQFPANPPAPFLP